ncbi:MAG: hypothetical protein IIA09_14745, partial [Proteobacteria bacterium]|nr:hypothetical protein [Pseudomonadota bacterium]
MNLPSGKAMKGKKEVSRRDRCVLQKVIDHLKREALEFGRYGPLYTPERYDRRSIYHGDVIFKKNGEPWLIRDTNGDLVPETIP